MIKMNIEIGEYIRTKQGTIGKAIEKYDKYCVIANTRGEIDVPYENIVKHSKNIIDLIEEGDYVNGVEVIDLADGIHLEFANDVSFVDVGLASYTDGHVEGIETIVTKEQFSNMEYRV